jgi:hypothetical protein
MRPLTNRTINDTLQVLTELLRWVAGKAGASGPQPGGGLASERRRHRVILFWLGGSVAFVSLRRQPRREPDACSRAVDCAGDWQDRPPLATYLQR